jgi:hypothetical protein
VPANPRFSGFLEKVFDLSILTFFGREVKDAIIDKATDYIIILLYFSQEVGKCGKCVRKHAWA